MAIPRVEPLRLFDVDSGYPVAISKKDPLTLQYFYCRPPGYWLLTTVVTFLINTTTQGISWVAKADGRIGYAPEMWDERATLFDAHAVAFEHVAEASRRHWLADTAKAQQEALIAALQGNAANTMSEFVESIRENTAEADKLGPR